MKGKFYLDIYELLIKYKFIKNESDFSVYWLGKSESCWRNHRCRDAIPSVGAIPICGSKLRFMGIFSPLSTIARHCRKSF